MDHRTNILSLLRRQGYESVSCYFSICPSLEEKYRRVIGANIAYQDYFDFPWRDVGTPVFPESEPVDWQKFYPDELHDKTTFDRWGVAHEPGGDAAMHMTRMHHPMKNFESLEQIQNYPYPDFKQASWDQIAEKTKALHGKGLAAIFTMTDMIWEIAWYLRSMEALMIDMAGEDEKAVFLLDKMTELACLRAENYAQCGIDILHTGDDVGMQGAMMMDPDFWREWLKPRLERVIRSAKRAKPDIIFSYHSCGFIEPIIEDLIDVGVDVLNPVQPECMDFKAIHERYGDRLSFWGTIGTQTTMPFGSPDDVRHEVHKNLEIAGDKGGLLCTPTHLLEPEVPWENIEAYVEACRKRSCVTAM